MAPIEVAAPEPLTPGCLDAAMALSREAAWNQLPADWQHFLDFGQVFGIREEGSLLGSAAILPYDGGFAWISMVLVRAAQRGRGLGTTLLRHCLDVLAESGTVAVLDATPAGEKIYRPLGFADGLRLTRWQGEGGAAAGSKAQDDIRPIDVAADLAAARALDAAVFGAPRENLLASFVRRLPAAAWIAGDTAAPRGAVFGRDGRSARQVGPLVADDAETAVALLDRALDSLDGPVFLDVADRQQAVVARLRERGFEPQRPFLRMARGATGDFGDAARLVAAAGPEFG